jgi:glycosyltransferase involved in cell wall biosynthesis
LAKRLELWIYRAASFITAVVPSMRAELVQQGVPDTKILDLPNGVDIELYSGKRVESTLSDDLTKRLSGKHVILYAGTHGRYHGLQYALDAAKLLEGQAFQFIFLGDGSEKPNLIRYAEENQINNVLFLDPVQPPEVADYLSVCEVFLSIIQIRTRAAKVLPALAAGKPILYAGAGDGADLVTEANAGIVVGATDAEGIAAGLHRLCIEDPELAARMGRSGQDYAVANLDWRPLVSRWVSDLENMSRFVQTSES